MPDGPVLCQPRPPPDRSSTVEWGATGYGDGLLLTRVPNRQRGPARQGITPIGRPLASAGSLFGCRSDEAEDGPHAITVTRCGFTVAGPAPPTRQQKRRPTTNSRGRLPVG